MAVSAHTGLVNPRAPLRRVERIAAIVVLLALGAVVVVNLPAVRTIQCDGSVPTWMITEENAGTGCVELLNGPPPSDWDGSWICIGMCAAPWSPFIPAAEP